MSVTYDKYYQTENLFGNPYPELIDFFATVPNKGKVLDLGCGQGRNAIPLARLGFEVTGIDTSKVGISQMNRVANAENLSLTGIVSDIYEVTEFSKYDYVLLDSMFHFLKKDRLKETEFIKRLLSNAAIGCHIVFCIQDSGKKVSTLISTIDSQVTQNKILDKKFTYAFDDKSSGHQSVSKYRLIVVAK